MAASGFAYKAHINGGIASGSRRRRAAALQLGQDAGLRNRFASNELLGLDRSIRLACTDACPHPSPRCRCQPGDLAESIV